MKKQLTVILAAIIVISAGWKISQKEEKAMNDLTAADPELAAIWSGFLNTEVIPQGKLDAKTRYLVLLAAHIATQSKQEYRLLLEEALDNGISPTEAKEAVYQTIPYAGMAKVYDFLIITNDVLADRGIKLPLANQATSTVDNRLEKGIAAQSTIFGADHIRSMRNSAPTDLKHIQDYLSANCFGDYYTRGGLDLKTRELLTFATLVAMGGADAQAKSHVQGNLNIGNDRDVLLSAVTQMLPYIGYPRSLNGIAAINEITKEKKHD